MSDATPSKAQKRVELLAAHRSPLDMCDLPQLYQDTFGKFLEYKSLGHRKLTSFVGSLPSALMERAGSAWHLSSSLSQSGCETAIGVGAAVTIIKVFGCLGCGKQGNVWGRLLNHMKERCPTRSRRASCSKSAELGTRSAKSLFSGSQSPSHQTRPGNQRA